MHLLAFVGEKFVFFVALIDEVGFFIDLNVFLFKLYLSYLTN